MPRGRPTSLGKRISDANSPQQATARSTESARSTRSKRFARQQPHHDAETSLQGQETLVSTPKILAKVVIPTSRSSIGSSLSSFHGFTSESENTPATSVAMTPAEAVQKSGSTYDVSVARLESRTSTKPASGKRKRTMQDELATADHLLARSLQAQKWYQSDDSTGPKRTRMHVADSEAEVDESLPSSNLSLPSRRVRARTLRRASTTGPTLDADENSMESLNASETSEFASESSDDESENENSDSTSSSVARTPSAGSRPIQSPARQASHRRQRVRRQPRGGGRRRTGRMSSFEDRATRERKKLERAHPEILSMWSDLESVPRIRPIASEQPSTITRKLKSFQLEGLDWMIKQEASHWRGGLLGDEMGMGKTIQAVSLVMSDYPATDPTLVVVPPVALMQWQSEIEQYTNGKLKVLIYHNTNPKIKGLSLRDLRAYDIVMISYSGLESIYRKESKGWKRDDGLVKENSKIHALRYHRIILDEAHSIKTRTTSVAKACFALKGDFRWCLSGTPVQNRIGEFFSLLRFLQVTPFASYFCKKCPCARLHWNQDAGKRCTECQHTGFEHVSIFNQELLNPITQQGDPAQRREGLRKLRLITDRIMLRRLKRDHTAAMELPPKDVVIHNEFFGEIERDFSTSIMSNTHRQFDTYVSRGVMLNNYANIFGLIMQMRQVANHPDLILRKHGEGDQNVLVCCVCDEVAEEPIRSRCHHEFCRRCARDYVKSFETGLPDCPRCHIPISIDFDQPDIEQDQENVKKNSIINRIKMDKWTSSTKIEMLVYDLYKLRSKKQTHKSIVFSQFTSMLQLVEWRLRRAGFSTVMLDGSMSPAQRQKSIDYFMNNVDVEVFLVSLKAGGVALNLTEASRVFIVDPWWNPAAEWQSADRCHRIGQKRPCVITRLCIEDSVESRIVMLQEKKANLINGTINNDEVAIGKLTPEDMQFLFRGG